MKLEQRLRHIASLNTPSLRALELQRCERDTVYWINTWCWTFDSKPLRPDEPPPGEVPFVLFPKQVDMVHWVADHIKRQKSGLIEKSRDTGVSFVLCAIAVHGLLFDRGFRTGLGSMSETDVDKRADMNSLFEKMRYMLRKMPTWMLPASWNWDQNSTDKLLTNPEKMSSCRGDVGANIGRGDRTSWYVIDEAASLLNYDQAKTSLAGTTNCVIECSTPKGMNGFGQRRHSLPTEDVFTISWKDDLRKQAVRTEPDGRTVNIWEEAKKKELGDPVRWAQEFGLDYTGSVEGIFIPAEWVRAAVNLDLRPSGPIIAGEDIAEEGKDDTVLIFRQGPVVTDIVSWGQQMTHFTAAHTKEHCDKRGVSILFFDSVGVGTGPKGIWNAIAMDNNLAWIAKAINVGDAASENVYWPDGRTSAEKFANLKAELWWRLRCRFERAYEFKELGVAHRPEDMISIPDHPQLIVELSVPKRQYNEKLKIKVESKKDLRARGVKSPDYADALVLAMIDPPADLVDQREDERRSATFPQAPRGAFHQAGERDDDEMGAGDVDFMKARF